MICYRDMTFCEGAGCQAFKDCPRALTDEVRHAAQAANMPTARFMDPTALPCYVPPEPKDKP